VIGVPALDPVEHDESAPRAGRSRTLSWNGGESRDGLDWQAFSAAYFPERRRHDLEALTAYGAYRRSRSVAGPSGAATDGVERAAAAAASAALADWEDEGGAAPVVGP
jgi:hypothetical protein